MSGTVVRSLDCKLYFDIAGGDTLVEFTPAADVSISLTDDADDVSDREGNGYKEEIPTLRNAELQVSCTYKKDHAQIQSIIDAYHARDIVTFAAMDGPIATDGNQGFEGKCHIFGLPITQNLREGVKFTFTARPAPGSESTWRKISE